MTHDEVLDELDRCEIGDLLVVRSLTFVKTEADSWLRPHDKETFSTVAMVHAVVNTSLNDGWEWRIL